VDEDDLPGRLAVHADGLNPFQDRLTAAFEHSEILRRVRVLDRQSEHGHR
jgi:hypothetical protein